VLIEEAKAMTEGIMIAIVTGCLAAIPTIIAVVVNNAKTLYRIDVLEKKVEKHNNYMERLLQAEVEIRDIKEDITEIKRG
jgi:hypothetical protein